MDSGTDDPPTSIIPPEESNYSQVIFIDVQKFYKLNTDLKCLFHKEQSFHSAKKDWIGIFKVGWKTTREYYTWISAQSEEEGLVLFKAYYLPKDDDYYQFCYVDQNGEVRGASVPFQFRHNITEDDEDDILMVTTELEIIRTNEENVALKETVEMLNKERTAMQDNISSLEKKNQSQVEKIKELEAEQLSSAHVSEKMEKENTELQCRIKILEEETESMKRDIVSLQHDLQQCGDKEQKGLSELKNMDILLKTSEAEKNRLQNENLTKQQELENLTGTLNQFKDHIVKLKSELEVHMMGLDHEKQQNGKLLDSLALEKKRALDMERRADSLQKNLISKEEKVVVLEQMLATQQDKYKKQGVENEELSCAVQVIEKEVDDLKKTYKLELDELHSRLLQTNMYYGNPYEVTPSSSFPVERVTGFETIPTLEEPQSLDRLTCPECQEHFSPFDVQVFEDHVICHSLDS